MAGMLKKVLFVMVACMVVSAPHADAAVSCSSVINTLLPCLNYLQKGGSPTLGCCNGVKRLNAGAKTTPDRKATCNCLKSAFKIYSRSVNAGNAASLPGKCGVSIPYKISPSTDCTKVT